MCRCTTRNLTWSIQRKPATSRQLSLRTPEGTGLVKVVGGAAKIVKLIEP